MMSSLFMICVLSLAVVACVTDIRGLKIPNIIPASIMILFIAYVLYQVGMGADYKSFAGNVIAGISVFVITFIFFALKMFGAGDAKLATAIAFCIGFKGLAAFLLFMAVTGGVLGLVTLVLLKSKIPNNYPKGWFKSLADGRPDIPYAIAIFAGSVAGFIQTYSM